MTLEEEIKRLVDKALQKVADRIERHSRETMAVVDLFYDGKIDFVEELRLLDEIDAKYAD